MNRILASSLMTCLGLAAPATAQDRCNLDHLDGADVLVRYPIPHEDPTKHREDHVPWTFPQGEPPTAAAGPVLFGNAPRVIGVGDFTPDGRCDLLWEEFEPSPHHAEHALPKVTVTEGLTSSPVFNWGIERPSLPWEVAGTFDVTGDGMADVLWWNPETGAASLWVRRINGWSVAPVAGGFTPDGAVGEPGETRPLTAIGRFEQDGPVGVIWTDRTQDSFVRYSRINWNVETHTLTLTGAGVIRGLEWSGWSIAATGDFDGDGMDDVLRQRESDDNLFVCYLRGLALRQPCQLVDPPTFALAQPHVKWFVAGPR